MALYSNLFVLTLTACKVDIHINLPKVMKYLLSSEGKYFVLPSVLLLSICVERVIQNDHDTHISQGLDGHSVDEVDRRKV